jgi:hypothetical protein
MFSRLVFGTAGTLADNDHLSGALVLTIAVIALAEVARPLRFLNLALGLWIALSPFLLRGATTTVRTLNDVAVGLLSAVTGFNVQFAAETNLIQQILFSYTCQSGYIARLQQGVTIPMFLTNPLWLTALATLITSLASLVWALRRKR